MKKRIWKRYAYLDVLGLALYIGEAKDALGEKVDFETELVQAFLSENQNKSVGKEETEGPEENAVANFEAENQNAQDLEKQRLEEALWKENQAIGGQGNTGGWFAEQLDVPREQEILEDRSHSLQEEEQKQNVVFTPHEKQADYDWETLKEYKNLIATFYAIDVNTGTDAKQLNLEALTGKDMTIDRSQDSYQILIYHSHSREGFSDSRPGERGDTIIGVGEYLTQILTEQYGYNVLHHTAEYDTIRDDAYAKALPEIEKLLEEHPGIQVVIDLHRDAGVEGVSRMVEIDGREYATFMLFNGLSYNRRTGKIKYLDNPNLADNLAFSFQVQVKAGQYYPGLTRKIYLKGYRYNMHLKPKTLLIELGDSNNTLQQAKNTCEPLAHILHMVLSGEG